MALQYKSDEDRMWSDLFKAALSGVCADEKSTDATSIVAFASYVADAALPYVRGRMISAEQIIKEPEPLFANMLEDRNKQQKQDAADSSFGVVR